MTRSDVVGICFWCLLYVVPIALVIRNPGARRDMLLRTARFVATWGVALCVAAGLGAGAMSGSVGLIGASLAMFLWVVWGALCFFAVSRGPTGDQRGQVLTLNFRSVV